MALEADLSIRGMDLYELPMWRIRGCVRVLARDPSTELGRSLSEEGDGYTISEHLLFLAVDALAAANWQRTGKRSGRPRRISPLDPANKAEAARRSREEDAPRVVGEDAVAYLEQFNPANQAGPVDASEVSEP